MEGTVYFKSVFNAIFTTNTLVPHDIKKITSCLLSPAEFLLWEELWKRQLTEEFPLIIQDPNNAMLTLDHLFGENLMSKPQDQAQQILKLVLDIVQGAAERALLTMPAKSIVIPNYLNIKQAPQETFIDFVD